MTYEHDLEKVKIMPHIYVEGHFDRKLSSEHTDKHPVDRLHHTSTTAVDNEERHAGTV